jgi:hypothetical protein
MPRPAPVAAGRSLSRRGLVGIRPSILTAAAAVLLALFGTRPASGAVEYRGVQFDAGLNWVASLTEGGCVPIAYRLRNGQQAQLITVVVQAHGLTLTRTHRLEAGEEVSGFLYYPVLGAELSYAHRGAAHFTGSRSGRLPPQDWIRFQVGPSHYYHPQRITVPRVLHIGTKHDATGASAAYTLLANRLFGRSSQAAADMTARVTHRDLPGSWVAYASLAAVVIEQAEASALGAEVKRALLDYVFAGGALVMVSSDADWCRQWWGQAGRSLVRDGRFLAVHGLGVAVQDPLGPQGQGDWGAFLEELTVLSRASAERRLRGVAYGEMAPLRGLSWSRLMDWLQEMAVEPPEFPRISYALLWWLMVAFVIVVGPVNYTLLRRRSRLPMFIVTAPLSSAVSGLVLLGVTVMMEGFVTRGVASGVTLLMQPDNRAISINRISLYTTRPAPLSFAPDTLVRMRFGREFGQLGRSSPVVEESALSGGAINLDEGMRLSGHFLPPRLVRAFGSAQVRPERGRMIFSAGADGTLTAHNGLGVELLGLLYRAADGRHYRADAVPAGATAQLEPVPEADARSVLEQLCALPPPARVAPSGNRSPSNLTGPGLPAPPKLCPPGYQMPPNSYAAAVAAPPGFHAPQKGMKLRISRHIVIGLTAYD